MQDRVPTKPNRYAVYDENHNFLRYEYHERADDPTQVGDALNKANLLPDAVAAALDLTGNPQVKDAMSKLKTLVDTAQTTANGRAQIATGSYTGTGTNGPSGKNTLAISAQTQVVIVLAASENYPAMIFVRGGARAYAMYGPNPIFQKVSWTSTQLSWYNESSAPHQLNNAGWTYLFVAIG